MDGLVELSEKLATSLSLQPQYLNSAILAHGLRLGLREPAKATTLDQLIMLLDLQGQPESAARIRNAWWQVIGARLWDLRFPFEPHRNLDPNRRLRVGYVSGDFKLHSCALIFGPIVFNHREDHEPILYSSTPHSLQDSQTKYFQQHPGWRDVSALDDQQLAEQIYRDEIDILVDLSGYTPYNRLPVFAMKPAPLQISAWGYSIGLGWPKGVMDAMIADPIVASPDIRAQLTEEVLDLPCMVGQCVALTPELNPLPCLNNPPTFGAFHQTRKLNPQVLSLWDRVLERAPESRLIFKGAGYTPEVIAWIQSCMPKGRERLSFWGQSSYIEHLAAYQAIDLTLDPFPQTGCVTCVESLMMGIPSVTLIGPTMIQRAAASILTATGCQRFIAQTEEEYISKAVETVTRYQYELAEFRKIARQRVTEGPLYKGYQAAYESALRGLWQRYCAHMKSQSETETAVVS